LTVQLIVLYDIAFMLSHFSGNYEIHEPLHCFSISWRNFG